MMLNVLEFSCGDASESWCHLTIVSIGLEIAVIVGIILETQAQTDGERHDDSNTKYDYPHKARICEL